MDELFVNVKLGAQAFTEVVANATEGEGDISNVPLVLAGQLWLLTAEKLMVYVPGALYM